MQAGIIPLAVEQLLIVLERLLVLVGLVIAQRGGGGSQRQAGREAEQGKEERSHGTAAGFAGAGAAGLAWVSRLRSGSRTSTTRSAIAKPSGQ